ncbi:nitrogen fixation protein NifZ [Thermocrinis sp.]|uniref:nitrogen fixation protein NifZ n=1 Tax=Thermocrinis sp. TaxID=2024383 RepID=UPI003BFEF67A
MMERKFNVGDVVRTKKKIKNDGTFPGIPWGELIVGIGEEGVIVDVGLFLLTKTIYTVYFPRLEIFVGCLENELELVDEQKASTI